MDVFATLADPTRRKIVELLRGGDLSVSEICERFSVSQPAISRHLRLLRQAGLVQSRPEAQRRVYELTPEPLVEMDRWLEDYRSFWSDRLDRLGDLLEVETREARQRAKERKKR